MKRFPLFKTSFISRFLKSSLTTVVLLAGLFGVAIPAHAGSGTSHYCFDNDGNDDYLPLLTSPITLGVELLGNPTHVALCYSTTPDGYTGPETSGGRIVVNNVGLNGVWGDCSPDNNDQGVRVGCSYSATPTYTITPGGANGGQVITVSIPFSVCAGQCETNPGNAPYNTGLIIGNISQPSAGGANAAYQLDSVCVVVDGIALTQCSNVFFEDTGVTTTGASPTNINSQGPCVLQQCLPLFGNSYVGTTGNQLGTVWLLGTPIPVYGEHTCVYNADAGTPCPY